MTSIWRALMHAARRSTTLRFANSFASIIFSIVTLFRAVVISTNVTLGQGESLRVIYGFEFDRVSAPKAD